MHLPTIDSPREQTISIPATINDESSQVEQRTNNVFKTVVCMLVTVLATTAFIVGLKLDDDSPLKEVSVIMGLFMASAGALGTAVQFKRVCCPNHCQNDFCK